MGSPAGTQQGQDQCRLLLYTTVPSGRQRLRAVRRQRLPRNGIGGRLRSVERTSTRHRRSIGPPLQNQCPTAGEQPLSTQSISPGSGSAKILNLGSPECARLSGAPGSQVPALALLCSRLSLTERNLSPGRLLVHFRYLARRSNYCKPGCEPFRSIPLDRSRNAAVTD